MIRPICLNIPTGKSEQDALPDELLELLGNVFQGVLNAFGDNAVLYKIDTGRIYESFESGGLVLAGLFLDRSDGEIFEFEINESTGKITFHSTDDFLEKEHLNDFLRNATLDNSDKYNTLSSCTHGLQPSNLLLEAIEDNTSDSYQSPFGSRFRLDIEYLAALSAAMYHGGVTLEAQPLYAGLHGYAINYALRGLRQFCQSIGTSEGSDAGSAAEAWVQEHGFEFAAAVVKEYSAKRSIHFQEIIQSQDQQGLQLVRKLVEEAVGMAMAATTDLIKKVIEGNDYHFGDVQAALTAAIDEYCPIDNSEEYSVGENAIQLAEDWEKVVDKSGCIEDLCMKQFGLASSDGLAVQRGDLESHPFWEAAELGQSSEEDNLVERIFYVNVGEGPYRNWDDCRTFGFLSAGCGRKWSKQLEKLQVGDTVIAYLKGYGYVGIGTVIQSCIPATKFMVNGVLIKELPLINDTIRSIKRFSKENGEYLVGIRWQVAVPREQAAWKANSGLFTTALVCVSLTNQPLTKEFARTQLLKTQKKGGLLPGEYQGLNQFSPTKYGEDFMMSKSRQLESNYLATDRQNPPLTCALAIKELKSALVEAEENDTDTDSVISHYLNRDWKSADEFLDFFTLVSIEIAKSATLDPDCETAELFGTPVSDSLHLGSQYYLLWEEAYLTKCPRLTESISVAQWDSDLADEIEDIRLIMLLPLATAYEKPIFDSLRNKTILDLTHPQEEFLGFVFASLAPGYFNGDLPPEILNVPSTKLLTEIFDDWFQYKELWSPSILIEFLSSSDSEEFMTREVQMLISRVIEGDDPNNPEEWQQHKEDFWSDQQIEQLLKLLGNN